MQPHDQNRFPQKRFFISRWEFDKVATQLQIARTRTLSDEVKFVAECESVDAGMVLRIEPGVYIPGKLGVRIEDDILVTAGGYEILGRASPSSPFLRLRQT
jgi:hypothetical protein